MEKESGQISKNEEYELDELKALVLKMNPKFFARRIFGRRRREALDVAFETFGVLIDHDKEGTYRLSIRE